MKSFFKGIGKGILYVVGFPFLLVGLCIAAVIGVFVFLFQFGKLIFLFFTGRTLFSDLDEDIKAKEIINRDSLIAENQSLNNSSLNLYPSDSPTYGSGYSSPLEQQSNENNQANLNDASNDESSQNEQVKQMNLFGEEEDHND